MNELYKTLICNGTILLAVMDTTDMVNDAIKIHGLTPLTSAALGRSLTACTFMSSMLKSERDKLSINIVGDGVGGRITVCGNGNLKIRGSIDNPKADLPLRADGKLDVGGCVGHKGRITVTRSMGLKEQYTGSAELISGEIAEDFAGYYAYSEQQPTAMALGVKIGTDKKCIGAGGVVIQALPGASDSDLMQAENIIKELKNVSTLIGEMGAKGILKKYFNVHDADLYHPEYKCLCSREYISGVLVTLGKEEVNSIVNDFGKVEVSCQFCNKTYTFDGDDVEKIFKTR